jgi:cytochrome c553
MYRNKKLLELARLLPCQHCGIEDGTVVAAHSNQLRDGKGRGLKASDFRIASLCFRCHAEADTSSTLTKVARIEMWEQAHRATIGELFERGLVLVNSKL